MVLDVKLIYLVEDNAHRKQVANYYYDYINNGSPDYEQAYFYYQIGAKSGYHAAMYMLSDMMINGQYVEKDVELGMSVLVNLYDELLHRFEKGEFLTDFPEVAYRMGNASMISSSKIPFTSPYLSASYYLQARTAYAIRSVLVSSNEDKQLGYDIVDALNNLNTFIKPKKTTFRDSIPNVLHNFITSIKDSTYTLKFKSSIVISFKKKEQVGVEASFSVNSLSCSIYIKLVFPTPELPIKITFNL